MYGILAIFLCFGITVITGQSPTAESAASACPAEARISGSTCVPKVKPSKCEPGSICIADPAGQPGTGFCCWQDRELPETAAEAIRQNKIYSGITDKEIEDIIEDWLRYAKERNAAAAPSYDYENVTPSPYGVFGKRGTTESALGLLDRVNTTDVPEEIEPVPDKTPLEKLELLLEMITGRSSSKGSFAFKPAIKSSQTVGPTIDTLQAGGQKTDIMLPDPAKDILLSGGPKIDIPPPSPAKDISLSGVPMNKIPLSGGPKLDIPPASPAKDSPLSDGPMIDIPLYGGPKIDSPPGSPTRDIPLSGEPMLDISPTGGPKIDTPLPEPVYDIPLNGEPALGKERGIVRSGGKLKITVPCNNPLIRRNQHFEICHRRHVCAFQCHSCEKLPGLPIGVCCPMTAAKCSTASQGGYETAYSSGFHDSKWNYIGGINSYIGNALESLPPLNAELPWGQGYGPMIQNGGYVGAQNTGPIRTRDSGIVPGRNAEPAGVMGKSLDTLSVGQVSSRNSGYYGTTTGEQLVTKNVGQLRVNGGPLSSSKSTKEPTKVGLSGTQTEGLTVYDKIPSSESASVKQVSVNHVPSSAPTGAPAYVDNPDLETSKRVHVPTKRRPNKAQKGGKVNVNSGSSGAPNGGKAYIKSGSSSAVDTGLTYVNGGQARVKAKPERAPKGMHAILNDGPSTRKARPALGTNMPAGVRVIRISGTRASHPTQPARNGLTASPARNRPLTAPARNGLLTAPARNGLLTAPARNGLLTSPPRNGLTAPARNGLLTSPSRNGLSTSPARNGLFISPARNGLHNSLSRNSRLPRPARARVLALPPIVRQVGAPTRGRVITTPPRTRLSGTRGTIPITLNSAPPRLVTSVRSDRVAPLRARASSSMQSRVVNIAPIPGGPRVIRIAPTGPARARVVPTRVQPVIPARPGSAARTYRLVYI